MIFDILAYLIWVAVSVLIVQFVLSLLISFNVVNLHNPFVSSLWHAVNVLLNPLLNPIRRFMPDTGGIDFSPMVLIILLRIAGDIVIPRLTLALLAAA
jgi:YggT family protein